MAFEPGNDYAKKGKLFSDALRKAIAQDDGKRVRACVEKMLDLAADGEQWAVKELADRLDGKAVAAISGPDGGPIQVQEVVRKIIDPADETGD